VAEQPSLRRVGRAVGQYVDPFMGLSVDRHGGIAVTPPQGEVVDADVSPPSVTTEYETGPLN
jgi:hypothetical protein